MATKEKPGQFDCYEKALPDEPMFILLARDPEFFLFVTEWAKRRALAIDCGEKPESDRTMVHEAVQCAKDGQQWRRENNGKWRVRH